MEQDSLERTISLAKVSSPEHVADRVNTAVDHLVSSLDLLTLTEDRHQIFEEVKKVCVCVCVCVCQRKTKDRADGMKEKSAHSRRRDSNLYLWDTRPPCFRLHHEGQAASRQSKQTL